MPRAAIFFALLYLTMIPIYAHQYLSLEDEFVQSNIMKESELRQLADSFSKGLERAIRDTLKQGYDWSGLALNPRKWGLETEYFNVLSVKYDDSQWMGALEITLRAVLNNHVEESYVQERKKAEWNNQGLQFSRFHVFKVRIEETYAEHRDNIAYCKNKDLSYVTVKQPAGPCKFDDVEVTVATALLPSDFPVPIEFLFPFSSGVHSPADSPPLFPYRRMKLNEGISIWLPVNDQLQEEMHQMVQAGKGIPPPKVGGYLRMLYFSVTTATTLGYGDIVPVTNRARMTVASEAILGVVLVGLFLNALARKKDA